MTYFLSPGGNDGNSGLSTSMPWRTPYHQGLHCGVDSIVALPSAAYTPSQFAYWGKVDCPNQNNVVWLRCAAFDMCKMTIRAGSTEVGMWIDESYWGVQGFEIDSRSTSPDGQTCFNASPQSPSSPSIRNIIFANNVAFNCPAASFGAGVAYRGKGSVDYLAYIANLSYAAAASNRTCNSGFVVFTPVAADAVQGTHIYVAGNFSIASSNPPHMNCLDGNGIIFDTFDGSTSNEPSPYAPAALIDNNIAVGNGGIGIRVAYSSKGSGQFGHIYLRSNTMWGNSSGAYQMGTPYCGEMQIMESKNVSGWKNLAVSNKAGCFGSNANPNVAYSAKDEDASSTMKDNWGYAVPPGVSFRTSVQSSNLVSRAFLQGFFQFDRSNHFDIDPRLANPKTPPMRDCSQSASVPACMADVVTGSRPLLPAARSYGYQQPQSSINYDPLFPVWLCNVTLPPGLVTRGCK